MGWSLEGGSELRQFSSNRSEGSVCICSSMVLFQNNPSADLASSLLHLHDKQQNYVNCISWKICKFAGCSTHWATVCIKTCELWPSRQHPNGIWKCSNIVMPHINGQVAVVSVCLWPTGNMMECTFPSDFEKVNRGNFLETKVKLSALIFLYFQKSFPAERPTVNLHQEEVRGHSIDSPPLLKTRSFCLFSTVMYPEHCL